MDDRGKSDDLVVPANPSNNALGGAAEAGEGRGSPEGNATGETRAGLRAGVGVSSELDRVRQLAREDKDVRFTALLHHVTVDRLVVEGPTCGRGWSQTGARAELRRLAAIAGVRRRFAPHQLRHAHAVEMAREGVPLPAIQRQLGHAHLGVTSTYLQGIDTAEIIDTIHARRPPMISASAGVRL